MPDRDPALEAALAMKAAWVYVYRAHRCLKDEANGIACGGCKDIDHLMAACEEFGRVKAFRSLGCATPEAQAALRELVRTALAFEGLARETDKEKDSQEVIGTIARGRYSQGAMIAAEALRRFARLATPPEEGR